MVPTEECPRYVPGTEDRLLPAKDSAQRFRERAVAVDVDSGGPPEEVESDSGGQVAPEDGGAEDDRQDGRYDGDVTDDLQQDLLPGSSPCPLFS
ncbi:MAG TPA: hypothetical protein VJL07_00085 [Dehalococcoidia bacterium]|nr:hypothetical protein [Dehalococcoidia bacterium]